MLLSLLLKIPMPLVFNVSLWIEVALKLAFTARFLVKVIAQVNFFPVHAPLQFKKIESLSGSAESEIA